MAARRVTGFLPQDTPPPAALISLGFQHVITMFPATVLCAILIGFDIGVTLFASGAATIVALLGGYFSRRQYIPLYYGSSFSYIAAAAAITQQYGTAVAQVGVIGTALVNIIVGLLVQRAGKERLDRILPPIITGAVAIVIGIALSKAALDMACCINNAPSGSAWTVALITLIATIMFSVYLRGRGLLGMLPVLLGAAVGYIAALPFGLVSFTAFNNAPLFAIPPFQLPAFGSPNALIAIFAIAPIAIATIPESTAHLYQISLYVDKLAEEMGRTPIRLSKLIGLNLVLDGLADAVNGLLGASPGTNYGENNSLMAISRNYSGPVLLAAGGIAMLLAFVAKLNALVGTLPVPVTGGLSIYLFGVIGMQGIALMMSERVNLFDPRQLAIGSIILVTGIGGNAFPGGNLPIGPGIPAIAAAAIIGILVNLVFVFFPVPQTAAEETTDGVAEPAPSLGPVT